MTEFQPYPTPGGVENAIKEAAKKATQTDPSLAVGKRIQLEYFNRFLSRVFSEGADTTWILKGGTGSLTRVPSSRSTRNIDLRSPARAQAQLFPHLVRRAGTGPGHLYWLAVRQDLLDPRDRETIELCRKALQHSSSPTARDLAGLSTLRLLDIAAWS